MGKRTFGSVRRLPSGRYQARYTGPDGATHSGRTPEGRALTFDSKQYADAYLSRVSADIQAGRWMSPGAAGPPARSRWRLHGHVDGRPGPVAGPPGCCTQRAAARPPGPRRRRRHAI